MQTTCLECGTTFRPQGTRGKLPDFCSNACKQKAYRARRKNTQHIFPELMRARRTWVRADGKRPIQPAGIPASSTDSATWSTFSAVQQGAGDGLGVMLGQGLGCYDLDKCLDEDVVAPWAREYIAGIEEEVVFVERSVSGRGLHLFFRSNSEVKADYSGGGEKYTRHRFIRLTFNEFSI